MHVFITLIFLLAACGATLAVTLIEDGKSDYRIVIPADAIPSEVYAAEELQRYLAAMSGVTLPVVTDAEPAEEHEILLGNTNRLRALRVPVDFAKLGKEGFTLRTRGTRVVIAGGRPRGTLYGVYAVLEEKLGVRWYTPDAEFVPTLARVALPAMNETQIPVFDYREDFWTAVNANPDFAARHRLNGQHPRLQEKHGGKGMVYYPSFSHSLDILVPRALFETHPEYFPMINGTRTGGYVQRCLAHPDVLKIAIASLRDTLRQHPDAVLVSVTQNDVYKYCECPQCKALDEAEGSPMGSFLRFVNAIAEDLERDYPHVKIDTFAYQYTRKPPRTIRPHPNVIIRLCSIECCFAHPLERCPLPANRRFVDDIKQWEKLAPRLDIWDYVTNFSAYLQPFPNFDVLQANLRFFARHNVKGVIEQGNYHGNGEMAPLRTYLLAKLLWNPEADVRRHTDEFLRGYYGEAAGAIRRYMAITHRPFREGRHHLFIFDKPTAAYLTDDLLNEADAVLAEAEKNVTDETIRARVQTARLPVWYVRLATNRVAGEERAALLQRFAEVARRSGVHSITEWKRLEPWLAEMETMVK